MKKRRKTGVIRKCVQCSKSFYVYKYRIKTAKYCSRKCMDNSSRICKRGHDTKITGRYKDGQCKICTNARSKQHREDIKAGKVFVYEKIFCPKRHDTRIVGRNKEGACSECLRIRKRLYFRKHRKAMLAKMKEHYKLHKDEISRKGKIWREKNKEKLRKRRKQYGATHKKERNRKAKEKRKNNINYRLRNDLRTRLYRAIKNKQKVGSAIRDLGCSIEFFKSYIARKFKKGMTWKNWGPYWELDHVTALMFFDLTDRKQFLKAVNYKNLQPLTIPAHRKKTNKEISKKAIDRRK